LWLFLFLTPSSNAMWFFYLYSSWATPLLRSYGSLIYILTHEYSIGPYFSLIILARCFCTCWIILDKIWKFFLISFQLVHHNFFINSMLSQIFFQLICKILLYNLSPFLRFCLKILHLIFCPHQSIVLQHLFIIL
jgi:hypothetical protein